MVVNHPPTVTADMAITRGMKLSEVKMWALSLISRQSIIKQQLLTLGSSLKPMLRNWSPSLVVH